jgi:hypothetical protein
MKDMAKFNFSKAVGLSALLFAAACSGSRQQSSPVESGALLPGDRPVAQPVHSVDLLEAMVDLENLALDELSANLQSDTVRETRLAEVERIADELVSSVTTLADLLDANDLPADRVLRFRELAEQLSLDAASLRDRAASGQVEDARDEREVLLETCNACHAEFRVMPAATDRERR